MTPLIRPLHGGTARFHPERLGDPSLPVLDFSANINPLGAPEWTRRLIARETEHLVHYPDSECHDLRQAIAHHHGIPAEHVLPGNGAAELLWVLPRALEVTQAIVPAPAYVDYAHACATAGARVTSLTMSPEQSFRLDPDALQKTIAGALSTRGASLLVILGQPNNPTGQCVGAHEIRAIAHRFPSVSICVDEAFGEFVDEFQTLISHRPPNVIVIRSMTKSHAIPGLRLGYLVADPDTAARVRAQVQPWAINHLAQAFGVRAVADSDYLTRTRELVRGERRFLADQLSHIRDITVFPSVANFLLLRMERSAPRAPEIARLLLDRNIAVRVCDNYTGLDDRYLRVAVRTHEQNDALVTALRELLPIRPPLPGPRAVISQRAPALMLQGTSSNAGKSVLAAAFCRILLQDGYRVAPFKAQNMSLNSYVTSDGGEMGRAQVVQAQACRLEPDVRMNPVLLKPSSDTGSQIIVMGRPVGSMRVREYTAYKPAAFERVREAYDSLSSEYEVMVLEGAGSPGEVNLKHDDIVNMHMARAASASVLLVGDIDRGGVYAAFVGTMEVLEEWERTLVIGYLVNRFRGDASLLADAHHYVEEHTGRSVLGVVPYLHDLGIPEEDSVSFKEQISESVTSTTEDTVTIALIDLPHVSNFTDLDALRGEPDVRIRVVRSAEDLGEGLDLDALIIPGSKNVIADYGALVKQGIAHRIRAIAANGQTEIVGICGGLQMLGRRVGDPLHIESSDDCTVGLGLLPIDTVLQEEKTLRRTTATHGPSGCQVRGYEIHHGSTPAGGCTVHITTGEDTPAGFRHPTLPIWGTYLHGVFDADGFRRWFVDRLRERRGLEPLGVVQSPYDIEPAIDRLAEVVRSSVEIDRIYREIGL